jgi:hypothetical protein
MEANVFDPRLKTHRLTGDLAGHYSSSCGYDCRIVFRIERNPKTRRECIVLTNVEHARRSVLIAAPTFPHNPQPHPIVQQHHVSKN